MIKFIKLISVFLLFFFLTLIVLTPISAQESSNSANLEEIQKSLQDRIKKALDENPDAATKAGQPKNRAVVGLIDSLNQNDITVLVNPQKGNSEHKHQISYSNTTQFTRSGKKINPDQLELGDYIIAIGQPLSELSLNANRIIVATYSSPTINTDILFTTISEIDPKNETITLTSSGNHSYLDDPLDVTSKLQIFNSKRQKLKLTDLSANQKAVAIITLNAKKKTTTLSFLFVFTESSQSNTPTPEQSNATNSASCGDGICQNVACFGLDCPTPESPETCPADCTK